MHRTFFLLFIQYTDTIHIIYISMYIYLYIYIAINVLSYNIICKIYMYCRLLFDIHTYIYYISMYITFICVYIGALPTKLPALHPSPPIISKNRNENFNKWAWGRKKLKKVNVFPCLYWDTEGEMKRSKVREGLATW